MIPAAWSEGIAAVPLPGFETVGEVLTAFIDQSARLQMANDRQRDSIAIMQRCEELLNASQKKRGLRLHQIGLGSRSRRRAGPVKAAHSLAPMP